MRHLIHPRYEREISPPNWRVHLQALCYNDCRTTHDPINANVSETSLSCEPGLIESVYAHALEPCAESTPEEAFLPPAIWVFPKVIFYLRRGASEHKACFLSRRDCANSSALGSLSARAISALIQAHSLLIRPRTDLLTPSRQIRACAAS
jgi:hypothetical protein